MTTINPIRWFIERVFDLVWPPEEGDPPVSFRQKVAGFVVIVLIILFAALVSR